MSLLLLTLTRKFPRASNDRPRDQFGFHQDVAQRTHSTTLKDSVSATHSLPHVNTTPRPAIMGRQTPKQPHIHTHNRSKDPQVDENYANEEFSGPAIQPITLSSGDTRQGQRVREARVKRVVNHERARQRQQDGGKTRRMEFFWKVSTLTLPVVSNAEFQGWPWSPPQPS